MLKAVLFDMDGVIIDTEPLHQKAYYYMFADVNIKVSDTLYQSFTGQSTLDICKKLVEYFNLSETPELLVKLKRQHFKTLFDTDQDLQLVDGVLELIKNYHQHGLNLVVASSASMPNINRVFERFNLNPYFSGKFSGADLKASKPHPEIFLKAQQYTGCLKKDCMVIEDSTNGVIAANRAGIYCVGYNSKHSKGQDLSSANKVISNYKEIYFSVISQVL